MIKSGLAHSDDYFLQRLFLFTPLNSGVVNVCWATLPLLIDRHTTDLPASDLDYRPERATSADDRATSMETRKLTNLSSRRAETRDSPETFKGVDVSPPASLTVLTITENVNGNL